MLNKDKKMHEPTDQGRYQLISFDMDGTLLTSDNTISRASAAAIAEAGRAGKEVILCTGRSISELEDFNEILPEVRYAICVSGSIIYDRKERKILYSDPLDRELIRKTLEIAGQEDVLVQFLGRYLVAQRNQCGNYPKYRMERIAELCRRISRLVPDLMAYLSENPGSVQKVNLYHTSVEARLRTRNRLLEAGLPLALKDSEITSLEVTRQDVTKATGLSRLCSHLGIGVSSVIAVGDAENDLDILRAAGLPVAMGNALPSVKEIVLGLGGKIVADNDHEGCAEAIRKYLLKKEGNTDEKI